MNGATSALLQEGTLQTQPGRAVTMGDVVDAVQVLFPFLVKHVLPLGSHYFDGVRSKEDFAGGPRNNEREHSGLLGLLSVFPSQ